MAKKKSKQEVLAQDVDTCKVLGLHSRIEKNSELIDEIVNNLVKHYCGDLDEYVDFIRQVLLSPDPPTPLELDEWVMNLPTLIYFTSEAQESLGIKEDVAKAIKMERYNNSYSSQEGTIPAREAAAELEVQSETIAHMAYSRTYKKIKARIEAAYEMLNSIKKVISRRMQEAELHRDDPGRTGVIK